ncbi:MAG: hypothetical protein JSS82_00060 [Bacteroidetes bacterium]|nr:hypothetical protein [Bacteroidota bacterium]
MRLDLQFMSTLKKLSQPEGDEMPQNIVPFTRMIGNTASVRSSFLPWPISSLMMTLGPKPRAVCHNKQSQNQTVSTSQIYSYVYGFSMRPRLVWIVPKETQTAPVS